MQVLDQVEVVDGDGVAVTAASRGPDHRSTDPDKQKQWNAFGTRTSLEVALPQVVDDLSRALLPLLSAIHQGPELDRWEEPGGPWRMR